MTRLPNWVEGGVRLLLDGIDDRTASELYDLVFQSADDRDQATDQPGGGECLPKFLRVVGRIKRERPCDLGALRQFVDHLAHVLCEYVAVVHHRSPYVARAATRHVTGPFLVSARWLQRKATVRQLDRTAAELSDGGES